MSQFDARSAIDCGRRYDGISPVLSSIWSGFRGSGRSWSELGHHEDREASRIAYILLQSTRDVVLTLVKPYSCARHRCKADRQPGHLGRWAWRVWAADDTLSQLLFLRLFTPLYCLGAVGFGPTCPLERRYTACSYHHDTRFLLP